MSDRNEELYVGTLRLRYQLAKDGCPESQLSVAKFLLRESGDTLVQRNCNAKVAVEWLILAAKQGNIDARCLLKQCYETGLGISGRNADVAQKCLRLSDVEVTSIRIGNRIFRAMSDSEENITERTFQGKVELFFRQGRSNMLKETSELTCVDEELCVNKTNETTSNVIGDIDTCSSSPTTNLDSQRPLNDMNGSKEEQEGISVTDIVTSVRQCLEGSVPAIALQRVVQLERHYSVFLMKYVYSFWKLLHSGTEMLVKGMGTEVLPCSLFLFFFFLYYFGCIVENLENSKNNLKIKVCCARIILMTIMSSCSCFIICQKVGFCNVEKWLTLIKLFEPSVPSEKIKRKFLETSTFPFCAFFISLLILTVLQPYEVTLFPSQVIFVFSVFLCIILDRTISANRYFVNISLLLNVVFCLCKQNFITVPDCGWLSFAIFDTCFVIYQDYKVHINIFTIFVVVLPYLYVKMANVKNGLKMVLLPHLMCLVWLNLTFSTLKDSDSSNIIYSCVFWCFVLIAVNYLNTIISIFVASLANVYFLANMLTCTKVLGLLTIFLLTYYFSILIMQVVRSVLMDHKIMFAILAAIVLSIVITGHCANSMTVNEVSDPKEVWKHYEQLCHHQSWYYSNTAETQISCLPFKGTYVSFEGKVVGIDVGIENPLYYVTNFLPSYLEKWFVCAFGDKLCNGNENTMSSVRTKERCDILNHLKIDRCQLSKYNKYHYDLHVEVSSRLSPEVIVKIDHACSNFVTDLMDGDTLQVGGFLGGGLGKALPEIVMVEANFSSYKRTSYCKTVPSFAECKDYFSLKQLIEFYFSPLIQYHPF